MQVHIYEDACAAVIEYMERHNVSARQAASDLIMGRVEPSGNHPRPAFAVALSVHDPLDARYGRQGYVASVMRYLADLVDSEGAILLEVLLDKHGKPVSLDRLLMYLNKIGPGQYSTQTRGLPKGQVIVYKRERA